MQEKEYKEILEKLDFIEFRQDLLFDNSRIDRSIYEYRITRSQYKLIVKLMDEYSSRIFNHESCSHSGFERRMYEIVPEHVGDYHMCEEFVKGFYDDGRWEEVFVELYGDMLKYSNLRK